MNRGKSPPPAKARCQPLFSGNLSRFDLVQHFLIEISVRLDAFIDGELPFDALAGGGSEALPLLRIARELQDGIADGLGVSRRTTYPVSPWKHRFGIAADIGDDHRQTPPPCIRE
jgi:hypothetical protein